MKTCLCFAQCTCCSATWGLVHRHWEAPICKAGEKGFIKDKSLHEEMGVTVNAGYEHESPTCKTKISIPAAQQLLSDFGQDWCCIKVEEGPPQTVKLDQCPLIKALNELDGLWWSFSIFDAAPVLGEVTEQLLSCRDADLRFAVG